MLNYSTWEVVRYGFGHGYLERCPWFGEPESPNSILQNRGRPMYGDEFYCSNSLSALNAPLSKNWMRVWLSDDPIFLYMSLPSKTWMTLYKLHWGWLRTMCTYCDTRRFFGKLEYILPNTKMQFSLKFVHIWKRYSKRQKSPDFLEHCVVCITSGYVRSAAEGATLLSAAMVRNGGTDDDKPLPSPEGAHHYSLINE